MGASLGQEIYVPETNMSIYELSHGTSFILHTFKLNNLIFWLLVEFLLELYPAKVKLLTIETIVA